MMMARNGRFPGEYRSNVVMNGDESEGPGSSGRIDMEIDASESSSIPLSNGLNLSTNNHDIFVVPTQALPLSGISPIHRKNLALRLRGELEQIRTLQTRFGLKKTNSAILSSSNDCQNWNKIERSSIKASGPGNNRGISGKFEVRQPSVPSVACLTLMKQCEALLKRLMSHKFGWVFNNPVDVVKLNLPDYFTVIKFPMDLGTIKSNLDSGVYLSPLEFLSDVRLTFSNAMTYNPRGNDVHFMADSMSKFFEARWKSIEKKIPATEAQIVPENSVGTAKRISPSNRRKTTSLESNNISEPIVERIMTDEEKHNLGRELESLIAEMPVHIVDFLRKHSSNGRETGEDEIEIDIDELTDDSLFTLRKLVDDYMQEKQNNHARSEHCEMEINEYGLSNSSMQQRKWNDPVDEDVDISGNDSPVSSFPPIEIEKDGAKASSHIIPSKVQDSVEEKVQADGKISSGDQIDVNQSTSGLDQNQLQPMPDTSESNNHQDENSGPIKKQVSPGKLYRAALLKNRFADTILKAKEKTLIQGEKRDPEKLRREKEQLVIQRKKEKARLQAEAKAAEDARRRAEVEAAEGAKRKRELEREAARQALLKIEKTVEINENSRFLEDLEMLRAPVEPLPISVDDARPDHPQDDGMGVFQFGDSNPLEQLGLYMKEDEEDEEVEPTSVPNSLEQIGLYFKKYDNEKEEECDPPPSTIAMPSEQDGLYMKNDEPSAPNPLEQFGLYVKNGEDEVSGPPSAKNPLEQFELSVNKSDEEVDVSNLLEKTESPMKMDCDEEHEPTTSVSNQLESSVSNIFEKTEMPLKKDSDEGHELTSAPNLLECSVSNLLEKTEMPKERNSDKEYELTNVPDPLECSVSNLFEKTETERGEEHEPTSVPNPSESGVSDLKIKTELPLKRNFGEEEEEEEEEEEHEPATSVPNPLECSVSNLKVKTESPLKRNFGEEEEHEPTSAPNPLESRAPDLLVKTEMPVKMDCDEEEEHEPTSVTNPLETSVSNLVKKNEMAREKDSNEEHELTSIPDPLESSVSNVWVKTEMPLNMDCDEEKHDPPASVPNPLECSVSNLFEKTEMPKKKDSSDEEYELTSDPNLLESSVSNHLENTEIPMITECDEEEHEPASVPNPVENSVSGLLEKTEIPTMIKDSEEEHEVTSVSNVLEKTEICIMIKDSEEEHVFTSVPNLLKSSVSNVLEKTERPTKTECGEEKHEAIGTYSGLPMKKDDGDDYL